MAFLRQYTNVDGDGQVAGQTPDSRGDFYDPADKQRDFDYWQAKIGDVLLAIGKTPSTSVQILQGGEVTDAGSGNVDLAEGWAIVKNAAGKERLVNRPAFSAVVFPVAFNDGRDVWVASRFEQALDATTRVHKTESVSYKFIHIDSFNGDTAFGETTDDMFFDSDPGANYVIWDKITMTGTTFAKIAGRSTEWKPFNSIDKIEDATDVDDSGPKVVDDLLVWDGTNWKRQPTGTKIFAKLKAETDTGDSKSLLNVGAGDARYVQGGGVDPGIINGNMQHWQTNASNPSIPDGTFFADLYQYFSTGPQVHDLTRDSVNVPTVSDGAAAGVNFSTKLVVTAVNTGQDIGENTTYEYNMEGLQFREYFGKTFTMTFMAFSTKPGIYTVSFRNAGFSRSYVAEYTINSASTWEPKSVTVIHDTTGSWTLGANAVGLIVNFTFAGSSDVRTTPGVWQSGNFLTTALAVNFDFDLSETFNLAHISFNRGISAFNNIHDDSHELQRIARYFKVWKDLNIGFFKSGNNQDFITPLPFGVPMMKIPAAALFNIVLTGDIDTPIVVRASEEQASILISSNSGGNANVKAEFDLHTNARL